MGRYLVKVKTCMERSRQAGARAPRLSRGSRCRARLGLNHQWRPCIEELLDDDEGLPLIRFSVRLLGATRWFRAGWIPSDDNQYFPVKGWHRWAVGTWTSSKKRRVQYCVQHGTAAQSETNPT